MGLSLKRSAKLIKKATEENKKEANYQWWLARYPLYTKDSYESFDEFLEKLNPQKVVYDFRDKDEIMAELLDL